MTDDGQAPSINPDLILDTMAEGVVVLDTHGVIRRWNPAMTDLTGYRAEEALGQHFTWLRFPGCPTDSLDRILKEPHVEHDDNLCVRNCRCTMRDRHDEPVPVRVNARPLHAGDGTFVGVLQTVTDYRPVDRLSRELDALRSGSAKRESFHSLIGTSQVMHDVYRLIDLAADSDVTVLLLGESGTGKELAANAIHDRSHRREQPFVTVNCGALPETILESELFGHVKGAFTGAYQDRAGRFEAAGGGSILLDEIGELSPALQVKLLRVLQTGEFQRVGENTTRHADVRVIAATNRDLNSMIRQGEFREDLYYRLRVFPITMPAVRERMEDLPLLVDHFIRRFNNKTGKAIAGLDEQALRAMMDYCWPGNVREIENAVEYAFVTARTDTISLFDLPQELRRFELRRETCRQRLHAVSATGAAHTTGPPVASEIVRAPDQLQTLLEECRWNKAEAARRLGISRTAVWKWMKRHGIPLQPRDDSATVSDRR